VRRLRVEKDQRKKQRDKAEESRRDFHRGQG
jgi:hypothetical protein